MIVKLSSEAESDIEQGYWFYEQQAVGLGDYFRECLITDIDWLEFHDATHEVVYGYHRMLARRFPFAVYYSREGELITIVAVLDVRRDPEWTENRLS